MSTMPEEGLATEAEAPPTTEQDAPGAVPAPAEEPEPEAEPMEEGATSDAGANSEFEIIRTSELREHVTYKHPILSADESEETPLLEAGSSVTPQLRSEWLDGGHEEVRIHNSDRSRLKKKEQNEEKIRTERRRSSSGESKYEWVPSAEPFREQLLHPDSPGYPRNQVLEVAKTYAVGLKKIEEWYDNLVKRGLCPIPEIKTLLSEMLDHIRRDVDLFVAIGIRSTEGKYPYRHVLQTTMLALAMGTRQGLNSHDLIELGIGVLLHDVGMIIIALGVVETDEILDQMQFLQVTRHPSAAFDLVKEYDSISRDAKSIIYQMHERFDGSGYPRRRREQQIHHMARLAMVADVYVALISPRSHRPALPPYQAVEQILTAARLKEFDPQAVRTLLETISLFPIGSRIETEDERAGLVLRANPQNFARPLVELHSESDPNAKQVVDLSTKPDLKVTGAN